MIKYIPIITATIISTVLTVLVVGLIANRKKGPLISGLKLKQVFSFSKPKQLLTHSLAEAIEQTAEHMKPFAAFQDIYRELLEIASDAKHPLMLVVTGEFKTGKSTFINTLLGENILKVDVTPATATVTKICYGDTPKLVAYLKDGSQHEYPLSSLPMLSAEGDPEGAKIRQQLDHLDVVLSNLLLDRYTIVDTPGLNSVYDYHTKATEDFISRADMVFWLFSLSNVGSKTEIASITSLGNELKPIAIINRIDEHDPEEDDLNDLIDNFRHRLGDSVLNVIGVSSLMANKAINEGDQEKLQESRWGEIIDIIEHQLFVNSENRKISRIKSRLNKVTQEIAAIIEPYEKEYQLAYDSVHGEGLTTTNLENKQAELISVLKLWTPREAKTDRFIPRERIKIVNKYGNQHSPLETLIAAPAIPEYITGHQELSKHRGIMNGVYDGLVEEVSKLKQQSHQLEIDIDDHEVEVAAWKMAMDKYNHSGFFGGTPIFDFSGKGRELENWGKRIDDNADKINLRLQTDKNNRDACLSRSARIDNEASDFCAEIRGKLSEVIAELDIQKKDIENTKKAAQKKLASLKWVPEAEKILGKKVRPKLNSLLDSINKRTTAV